MRIFSLADPRDAGGAYPCATEMPRPFWADGLELSRSWFAENLGCCVEGVHVEEEGRVIGHIYWAPSERALVPYKIEPGVAWLYCEWIQRPYQERGYMRKLFSVFIEHLKGEGYKWRTCLASEASGWGLLWKARLGAKFTCKGALRNTDYVQLA